MKQYIHKRDIAMDVEIAKELRYSKRVIEALKAEKDPYKRSRILRNARNDDSHWDEHHLYSKKKD